ncbi:hypothetical protein CXB51_006162 [Gossypium anomalum]|uniref:Reverse transcriptase zinc-binding domain-containing protein n=1 Tax=Gossypium anomalum TaxID=47600 RepID=A0A8J5ZCX2_9ROSI|nr:hypothetical protein CXB51_006162 [Gossypium anomalum]
MWAPLVVPVSLWSLRDILEKGLGYCMGIGTSVSIWNECWLSRPSDCKVQPIAVTTFVSWVSDLMVPSLYKGDEVKIYDIFVVDEAERILSIPLAQFGPPDILVWKGSTRLYTAKIPPKIRITCWRFCNNYVPTLFNPYNRWVMNKRFCHKCSAGPETVAHVVWECLIATALWQALQISWHSHSRQSYSGIIVRNEVGLVLGATIKMHSNVPNAFVVETFAFVRVVCFTTDLGFMHVIIEGDPLAVGNRVAHHIAAIGVARSVQGGGGAYCRH